MVGQLNSILYVFNSRKARHYVSLPSQLYQYTIIVIHFSSRPHSWFYRKKKMGKPAKQHLYQGFIQDIEFGGGGGTPKFGIDMKGML